MEQGEKTAKNHCAATVLEDFVNALWRVITVLDFYKFKLEFIDLILFDSKQTPHPVSLHNNQALYKKHLFLHSKVVYQV